MRYQNIDAERARLGKTNREISKELGVSVRTLYNWQKGIRPMPVDKLEKLCDLFCCPADYLLGRTSRDHKPS